jgi:voltage-gated potassium channel
MPNMNIKKRVYDILEYTPDSGSVGKIVNIFLIILIIINVILVIFETKVEIYLAYRSFFTVVEVFSVIVFTIEYILRVWSITMNPRYHRPVMGRLSYMVTFFAIIDLLSFAPFYLPLLIPMDLRFLRVLRLFRIFRIFKLGRYSQSFTMMKNVFSNKKEDIGVALLILCMILIIASCGMYYAEHTVQPDKFSSIPDTMWWTIITVSTIGYGDVYPVTNAGKILGGLVAIVGVCFFALPTGIIASGYVEELEKKHKSCQDNSNNAPENNPPGYTCIHCGKFNPTIEDEK